MSEHPEPDSEPMQTFAWDRSDGPSSALVLALSDVCGADPDELNPLYEAVDPDALDTLFISARRGLSRDGCIAQFEYDDHLIVISADGNGYIYN